MPPRQKHPTAIVALFLILILPSVLASLPLDYIENNTRPEPPDESAAALRVDGETPYQLVELASFKFASTGSDCWGWTASDGTQYAVMGINAGLVFINVSTQSVVDTVPGSGCTWQDMKSYQHFMYAVSECGTGLRVIDMSFLPDSVHLVSILDTDDQGYTSSHNIAIDTVRGYLYAETVGIDRAISIFDLTNPSAPLYVNSFGIHDRDLHDMYVMNDTAYIAGGSFSVFEIWDMADKMTPVRLTRVFIPNAGYVHNIWPTNDRKFVVTTEETTGKTVKLWHIEDLSDIRLVSEFLAAPNTLAHNAHIQGDFLYLSHYFNGFYVLDLTKPFCLETMAYVDLPNDDCWGVYPHNSDSLVYASHLDGSFYIYQMSVDPLYSPTSPDSDGDGTHDNCDNCLTVANIDQADRDVDGIGDACDVCPDDYANDADNDGVCDDIDNCANYNPDQIDTDNDGLADACDPCVNDPNNDEDFDAICGDIDNCPTVGNELQLDGDNDGVGDLCDECPNDTGNDPDNDNLCAAVDNCPTVANVDQTDSDGDGFGDACDLCPGVINTTSGDNDGDGLGNDCDNCPDHFNPDQTDTNNDGIGDVCCCRGIRGNTNYDPDDILDISDLLYIVDYVFASPPGPMPPCFEESDTDANGMFDISDLLLLVDYFFADPTGPPPTVCP